MFNFDPIRILLTIPGIILGLAFHEFAHAFVADRLGDPTPRNQGRLTLSPIAHVDPIGLLLIVLVGFGWAKPVEINPRYYRNPRRDDTLVSLAGPMMNILIAIIFAALTKIFLSSNVGLLMSNDIARYTVLMFYYAISINIMLSLFNLLPIPPLDGFHILSNYIPPRNYKIIYFLHRYGSIILILLILTNITTYVIGIPTSLIFGYIRNLFNI